ncbi:unnamed protein product [Symbiodinium natans]|uniref:type II protein arginine methyltransferase n=1 Tax=Symbiodinium natans TaxID=878477 RepID=A0A812J3P1_9DINO|nr:unnamed protein product [Symbiodinium natans]
MALDMQRIPTIQKVEDCLLWILDEESTNEMLRSLTAYKKGHVNDEVTQHRHLYRGQMLEGDGPDGIKYVGWKEAAVGKWTGQTVLDLVLPTFRQDLVGNARRATDVLEGYMYWTWYHGTYEERGYAKKLRYLLIAMEHMAMETNCWQQDFQDLTDIRRFHEAEIARRHSFSCFIIGPVDMVLLAVVLAAALELLQKLKALVMLDSRALTVAWRANLLRTTTVDDEDAQYFPRIRAVQADGQPRPGDRLLHQYRQQMARTNGTILLSTLGTFTGPGLFVRWGLQPLSPLLDLPGRARYRELRRLALRQGLEAEQALLVGGPQLPGRMHSDEVYFSLSPARCQELQGWRERHAQRLAAGAKIRAQVAHLYDKRWSRRGEGTLQLKLLVQPGHAQFVQEASALVDEGFLVSMDYGADADALLWQALVHPNHEGIHIMDARQATSQCAASYLECPGLQDITMTVDFTEAAEAGRQLAQWTTRAYGPIFHLELAHDSWLQRPIANLLERAGGPRTVGLHAWYRHSGVDAWASFKILVQQRGQRGRHWALGAAELSWPLQEEPALARSPMPCWNNDMTKPTLASLIALDARGLGSRVGAAPPVEEAFRLRLSNAHKLQEALDQQHAWQRQAYRDLHLAQLLADYYLHFARERATLGARACTNPDPASRAAWLDEVHMLATSRRLPEMHGPEMFDRVFAALAEGSHGNLSDTAVEPFLCTVTSMVASFCLLAAKSVVSQGG